MKYKFRALGSLVIAGVLLLSSCVKKNDEKLGTEGDDMQGGASASTTKGGNDASQPGASEEVQLVNVAVVSGQYVPDVRQYTANVQAYNLNNISPSTMNRITSIGADVGDRVQKGQVLVTLDDAALTQLETNISQYESDYKLAQDLLAIGSGTQTTVDRYKRQLDAARTQYRNLKENTVLTSPATGVVTARNYDPGDMVGSMPILTIGQINPNVKILININESDRSKVRNGMGATITFDAYPEMEFNGTISRIYPSVDAKTRTFQAEVLVPNKDSMLVPGMFARVTMDMGGQNLVVAPDRAITKQTGAGNEYVYVYRDGKIYFTLVETGRKIDDTYPILSGLNVGDTVVTSAKTRLANGIDVRINQ